MLFVLSRLATGPAMALTRRQILAGCVDRRMRHTATISPWLWRNHSEFGRPLLTEGYASFILVERIAYNDMSWRNSASHSCTGCRGRANLWRRHFLTRQTTAVFRLTRPTVSTSWVFRRINKRFARDLAVRLIECASSYMTRCWGISGSIHWSASRLPIEAFGSSSTGRY